MTELAAIIKLTFRELWARKIVVGLFIVATLVWVMLAFALNLDIVEGSLAGIRIFGQEGEAPRTDNEPLPIQQFVVVVEAFVAGAAYWVGILLSLFATASLLPHLLERGRVDLTLSKPISRTQLLTGHVLGVTLAMLLLVVYLLGMTWLVMSLKSGVWNTSFLFAIGVVLSMFVVMYSIVVLVSVTTQSTALALIVTYGLIFASVILGFKEQLAPQITLPWRYVFIGFYHALPHFGEVTRTVAQLAGIEAVGSLYPLGASLLIGGALYLVAALLFNRRDF